MTFPQVPHGKKSLDTKAELDSKSVNMTNEHDVLLRQDNDAFHEIERLSNVFIDAIEKPPDEYRNRQTASFMTSRLYFKR